MTHFVGASDAAPVFHDLAEISVDVHKRDVDGCWTGRNKLNPFLPEAVEICVLGYAAPAIKALSRSLLESRPKNYDTDSEVVDARNIWENQQLALASLRGWRSRAADGRIFPVVAFLGQTFSFNADNRARLLQDPRLWKFVQGVLRGMNEADDVALTWEKAAEKNSGDGSEANSPESGPDAMTA